MVNLDSLPLELFEQIAESVPAETLISLRHVNRQCCTKVLKTYAKAYYGHRSIKLGNIGMLAKACDVVANNELAKAIRSITFSLEAEPIEDGGLWLVDLEDHFQFLLVAFFGLLKGYADLREIRIADANSVPSQWYRTGPAAEYYRNSPWPCTVVSEALYFNEIFVPSFVVGDVNTMDTLQWNLVCSKVLESARDYAAFVRLTTFLTTFELSGWIDEDDEDTGDQFMGILAEAPFLEQLHLSQFETDASRISKALFRQTFPVLRRLIIRDGLCSWSEIVHFARKQPALRELDIEGFGIGGDEDDELKSQVDINQSCAKNLTRLTGLQTVTTDWGTEDMFDEIWHN